MIAVRYSFLILLLHFSFSLPKGIPRHIKEEQTERLVYNLTNSSFALHDCQFSNFQSTELEGGAIYVRVNENNGANYTINNCIFNTCNAKIGGAIFINFVGATARSFLVSGSSFQECTASNNGGAIYLKNNQYQKHVFGISDCTFTSNNAAKGGAIYGEVRDQFTLENNEFSNNEATTGSSLYLLAGSTSPKSAEHSIFNISSNIFSFTPSAEKTINVHIVNANSQNNKPYTNFNIGGCTFSKEGTYDGDIKHLEITLNDQSNKEIESIYFSSCNCVQQDETTFSIPSDFHPIKNVHFGCSSISSCTPPLVTDPPTIVITTPPPGEYIDHDREVNPSTALELIRSYFRNYKFTNENGGAILINDPRVSCSLDDCKFETCSAQNGGAIYVNYKTNAYAFVASKCSFLSCESSENGGALYLQNSLSVTQTFEISGCTFTSNKAVNGGAIYGGVRDQFTLENNEFSNNEATIGSSLYLLAGSTNPKSAEHSIFNISSNIFSFTPSAENTINVHIVNANSQNDKPYTNFNIGGCTFSKEGTYDGDIKHLEITLNDQSNKEIESIYFSSCNCVQQDETTFSIPSDFHPIKNVHFGCSSIDSCTTSKPSIPADPNYQTITENFNDNGTIINLHKVEFYKTKNEGKYGGAILIKSIKVDCTIDDCKFTSCEARFGGAISIEYAGSGVSNTARITNSYFTCCNAEKDGGALYIGNTQQTIQPFLIEGCTFTSNTAGEEGGAIMGRVRDVVTINKCTFDDNTAETEGASIWLSVGGSAKDDKNNTFIFNDNNFIFTPTKASNVYIETVKNTNNVNSKNANLYFGDNKFSTKSSNVQDFKHLKIVEQFLIESINFNGCNCVQQDSNTFSIPNIGYPIDHVDFNCNSNSCNPDTPITLPPTPPPDQDGYNTHDRLIATQAVDLEKYKFVDIKTPNEDGGAIIASKVNCNLVNCKFSSCNGKNGGAICLKYSGDSNHFVCTIKSTEFTSNSATQNGGAIFIDITQSDRHSATLFNCTFRLNKAQNGGAVYANGRDLLTIDHCTFEENNATVGSSLWVQVGYNDTPLNNKVIIISCSFSFTPFDDSINVYAKSYNIKNATTENINANLYISLCRFSSTNTNANNYKHLVVDDSGAPFQSINIPHCMCVAQKETDNTITLPSEHSTANFTFECNGMGSCKPSSDKLNLHDRIAEQSEPIDIKDFKFVDIHSDSNGGAILIDRSKTNCTIRNCRFELCNSQNGGAIYLTYTGKDDVYICTITETVFVNNNAKTFGGAIYCTITQPNMHSITITDSKFISNTAGRNGGAIYADTRDKFTLKNCVFEENQAEVNGSSLWCRIGINDRYTHNVVTIQDNKFTFTPESSSSNNVFLSSYTLNDDVTPNANLVFGNCLFAANGNKKDYLHLKIYQYKSQFESITFSSCSCVQQENSETISLPKPYKVDDHFAFGCNDLGSCTAKPSQPTPKPTADTDGYIPSERINRVEFEPKVILSKVKFTNIDISNTKYYGGAIYASKVPLSLTDCKIDSCQSSRGGGIYVYYTGELGKYKCTILNTIFNNCNATTGGAIYASITQPKRHYITIEGCTFTDNKAVENGGALYCIVRDCFSLQHSTFTNNKAAKGSSVWCKAGQNQGNDADNRIVFYGNTFSFTPSDASSVNVYIESNELKEETEPNANVLIGRNSFTTVNSNVDGFKNLEINEVGEFQSISFIECNCIQGAESTVSITAKTAPKTENLLIYNCQNIDQCPSPELPPASGECEQNTARQESFGQEISLEKACFSNFVAPTGREGGAIRIVNAKIELEECRFTNCSSLGKGGAVYISLSKSHCEVEVEDCIFTFCSAECGGAIYFFNTEPSCESSFEGCRFENNKAVESAGAFYYSPCANSEMKKCFFLNNTCSNERALGSSLYAYVSNNYQSTLALKKRLMKKIIKNDDDDNGEIKPVIIEGNRFRSEPVEQSQQLYINLKKSGQLQLESNSFSFNKAEEIPKNAKYISIVKDEGAAFDVKDEICIDNNNSVLVSGIDSSLIKTDCHTADADNDGTFNNDGSNGDDGKKKNNVGLIVGIVVAVVVVIAIVIVVVVMVLRRNKYNRYVSDLNEDDIADNSTNVENESNL